MSLSRKNFGFHGTMMSSENINQLSYTEMGREFALLSTSWTEI